MKSLRWVLNWLVDAVMEAHDGSLFDRPVDLSSGWIPPCYEHSKSAAVPIAWVMASRWS